MNTQNEHAPKITPGCSEYKFDVAECFHYYNLGHLDAATNLFLSRELLATIPKLLQVVHGQKNARLLFPINRSIPAGAQSYKWEQEEDFGSAAWVTGHGHSIPTVNSVTEEKLSRIESFATGAIWTVDEIRTAAFAGRPINPRYARAARRIMLEFENGVVFNGNSDRNITGVFSGTAITSIPEAAASNGSWAIATQANRDDILEDLHQIGNDIVNQSLQNYGNSGVRLIMSLAKYHVISQTSMSITQDHNVTILKTFLEQNPHVSEVMPVDELRADGDHAGVNSSEEIMMAYEPSPDNMEMVVPLELMQHAPERVKLATEVMYEMRTGGMSIYRPLTASIRTGI
ncbi:MAG: DUF2184 domain-containing protein [bacterium]|nr:DUF2184 domain-containing protein [bacterium]